VETILTITDQITGAVIECPLSEVGNELLDLYPNAMAEMVDAVKRLQYALDNGDPTDGWEQYLAIRIERI